MTIYYTSSFYLAPYNFIVTPHRIGKIVILKVPEIDLLASVIHQKYVNIKNSLMIFRKVKEDLVVMCRMKLRTFSTGYKV